MSFFTESLALYQGLSEFQKKFERIFSHLKTTVLCFEVLANVWKCSLEQILYQEPCWGKRDQFMALLNK